jgi:hypothetical protein
MIAAQGHNGKDIDVGSKKANEAIVKLVEDLGYLGVAAAYRGVEQLYD